MSDSTDALARAIAANRKLAAGLLVRKEELEAELGRAGGEGAAAEALRGELGSVEAQLQAALAEVAELRRLAAGLPAEEARALVRSVTDPDPLLRSPEDEALDRVRAHLAELEGQLGLARETSPAAPAPPEDAEAEARRQLEELRARRPRKL